MLSEFQARRDTILWVGPNHYRFLPHPLFPNENEVFFLEGGQAIIYQLQELASGHYYALKVLKPSYRDEQTARVATALAGFAHFPGLAVSRRVCLTKATYPELLAAYPGLQYALLMPWIAGRTWAGFLLDRQASATYALEHARHLSLLMAQVLAHLEMHQLAHSDVAGSNVILSAPFNIELLDMEGLWMHGLKRLKWSSRGSPGYQHRRLGSRGQWRPEGDRFAAAILLTEMLIWWNPQVRAHIPPGADTFFLPDELQQEGSLKWQVARQCLQVVCPPAVELFDQAWTSRTLKKCPPLSAWAACLASMQPESIPLSQGGF